MYRLDELILLDLSANNYGLICSCDTELDQSDSIMGANRDFGTKDI